MGIGSRLKMLWTAGQGVTVGLADMSDRPDPVELFRSWFEAASDSGIYLHESMALSTVGADGRPSSRMVLLKAFDASGFVFYTNYGSRKAAELDAHPHAALLFHWAVLQRQVRIEGAVSRIDKDESAAYFASRDRGSRLGAWASKQSRPLESRQVLEERMEAVERRFSGEDVPLPEFWGGYRLIPESMEFWQGRVNRLHDRIRFTKGEGRWEAIRLYP